MLTSLLEDLVNLLSASEDAFDLARPAPFCSELSGRTVCRSNASQA